MKIRETMCVTKRRIVIGKKEKKMQEFAYKEMLPNRGRLDVFDGLSWRFGTELVGGWTICEC